MYVICECCGRSYRTDDGEQTGLEGFRNLLFKEATIGKAYANKSGARFQPVTWPDGYRVDVKIRGARSRRTAPYNYLSDAWGPNPDGLFHAAREVREKAVELRLTRNRES